MSADDSLTVRELRWILSRAPGDVQFSEARVLFAAAERQAAADAEHADMQREYHEYIARRQTRELEAVQSAYDEARDAAIRSRPISREGAALAGTEAADVARTRFLILEPRLEFEEWQAAGRPSVHRTGDGPRARPSPAAA